MTAPFIFIGTHRGVKPGKLEEFKAWFAITDHRA
jgi:hypothetical protein